MISQHSGVKNCKSCAVPCNAVPRFVRYMPERTKFRATGTYCCTNLFIHLKIIPLKMHTTEDDRCNLLQSERHLQTCMERFYDDSATGFATHLLEVCCPAGSGCVAGIPVDCDSACVSLRNSRRLGCTSTRAV